MNIIFTNKIMLFNNLILLDKYIGLIEFISTKHKLLNAFNTFIMKDN